MSLSSLAAISHFVAISLREMKASSRVSNVSQPSPGGFVATLSRRARVWMVLALLVFSTAAFAQDKPDESPQVLLCNPLGVLPGETIKVTARGLRLEGTTEVKSSDGRVTTKFVSQGKTPVPQNQDPKRAGDNQVEFEIVVPGDFPSGNLELTCVAPKGEVKYQLPIGAEIAAVREKEPNPGFKQSQTVQFPQTVIGSIEGNHDVDVYLVQVPAGTKLVAEVFAWRLGSALDSSLSLYDSSGRKLATNDDSSGSRDSRIAFTVPAAATYFIVVQDANDLGGPASPYRLVMRGE